MYPPGTWPTGFCPVCNAENERDIAVGALQAIVDGENARDPWGIIYREVGGGEAGLKEIAARAQRVIMKDRKKIVEELDGPPEV